MYHTADNDGREIRNVPMDDEFFDPRSLRELKAFAQRNLIGDALNIKSERAGDISGVGARSMSAEMSQWDLMLI